MAISTIKTPVSQLDAARELVRNDRAKGLSALNNLFRSGSVPEPAPAGRYRGEMLAIDLALFQWLANLWMPWTGKIFDPSHRRGDNVFTKDSYLLARLFNPLYRGFVADGPHTYRAFAFRTFAAPGLFDPDRVVLKIDTT